MIEGWLVAVRDHPDRPPTDQCHVLTMLALRMDWRTGRGFASASMLMDDANVSRTTVWRATKWARSVVLLVQTRRGHRISATVIVASEWQLTQGFTSETLATSADTPADTTQCFNGSDPMFHQKDPIKRPLHQEPYKGRSAARSHKPRTHDGSSGDVPGAQQIPDVVPPEPSPTGPYGRVVDMNDHRHPDPERFGSEYDDRDSPWSDESNGFGVIGKVSGW